MKVALTPTPNVTTLPDGQVLVTESFIVTHEQMASRSTFYPNQGNEKELETIWFEDWKRVNAGKFTGKPDFVYNLIPTHSKKLSERLYVGTVIYKP